MFLAVLDIILFFLDILFVFISLVFNPLYNWISFGLVIVTLLLFYYLLMNRHKTSKKRVNYEENTQRLYIATKKKIYNYLKSNEGRSYTIKEILNKIENSVEHPYFKKYVKKNGRRILEDLLANQVITSSQNEGEDYYLYLTK
jgi:predicted membrane protein